MNVVDSSGWLEYFANGPNASFFAPSVERAPCRSFKIKERVNATSLDFHGPGGSRGTTFYGAFLQHSRMEPLAYQAIQSPVIDSMPYHLPQPLVIQCPKEVFNIGIQYPSYRPPHNRNWYLSSSTDQFSTLAAV